MASESWAFSVISPATGKNLLDQGKLFCREEALKYSENALAAYSALAWFFAGGLILFFLLWGGSIIMSESTALLGLSALFSIIPVAFAVLLAKAPYHLPGKILANLNPGLGILCASVLFACSTFWWQHGRRKLEQRSNSFLFLFGIPLLVFFCWEWSPNLGNMSFFSDGDDPWVYQAYARQIIVEGDLLHHQEPILVFQPLYRYLSGALHLFWGQSVFVQKLLDVWAITLSGHFLQGISVGLGASPFWGLQGSILYLLIALLGPHRFYMGWGMQEFAALFFQMAAMFLLVTRHKIKPLVPAFLALLAFFTRMDHLPLLAGLPLLKVPRALWRKLFVKKVRPTFQRLKPYFKWLGTFWLILLLGLGLVLVRNRVLGGQWVLNTTGNLKITTCNTLEDRLKSVVVLLNGGTQSFDFRQNPEKICLLPLSFLLWTTVLLSIFLTLRGRPSPNISLAFIFWTGIGTFLFASSYPSYPPRFSIHLLPIACLYIGDLTVNEHVHLSG